MIRIQDANPWSAELRGAKIERFVGDATELLPRIPDASFVRTALPESHMQHPAFPVELDQNQGHGLAFSARFGAGMLFAVC